jgi:hypothetical protein
MRNTTLPRSSDRESKSENELKNEGGGESENEIFASKYWAEVSCVEVSINQQNAYVVFQYNEKSV